MNWTSPAPPPSPCTQCRAGLENRPERHVCVPRQGWLLCRDKDAKQGTPYRIVYEANERMPRNPVVAGIKFHFRFLHAAICVENFDGVCRRAPEQKRIVFQSTGRSARTFTF